VKAAVAFLTVLGGPAAPDARTMAWFPAVGALMGLALGGAWWAAGEVWAPFVAAALVVVADLALTGLLHVDGLADSADGLLPPLGSAERRLEVMADPATGAFGVAVVGAALLLRTAGLASIEPDPLALAGLWCASRTLMATAALGMRYVRPGGLAASFVGPDASRLMRPVALGGMALAGALAAIAEGGPGVGAVVGVAAGALGVLALAQRRIGGFTGDVLGAAAVVGETTGLLVLAARW
jgi:adenosylcobinamide-GDP ribazoletransferase